MLVVIFITEVSLTHIIRWVNIHTLHLFPIPCLQKIQCLKVFAMYQQPIHLLIKVFYPANQLGFKLIAKKLGIQYQLVIGF